MGTERIRNAVLQSAICVCMSAISFLFLATICYGDALISQGKLATAFSSEIGHAPNLGNDSDTSNSSFWSAPMAPNQNTWWQLDLQTTYQISSVKVRNFVDGNRHYQYRVRGSLDGLAWFPLAVRNTNAVAIDAGDSFSVSAVVRYVRVNGYRNSANNSFHLSNVEVYGHEVVLPSSLPLAIQDCLPTQDSFEPGEPAQLSCTLKNLTSGSIALANVSMTVDGISNPLASLTRTILASNISIAPGSTYMIHSAIIAALTDTGAYGISLQYTLNGMPVESYVTFLRVRNFGDLIAYSVKAVAWHGGVPIYALDGGMSAENGVVKAAEQITRSDSASWIPEGLGGGPKPVFATPRFLKLAIDTTIDLYDDLLGSSANVNTVVIGPEPASVPYLTRAMRAPYLPSHFLMSSNSALEVATVLDQATRDGYSAFATEGFDCSMPGVAVSWIELLRLPPEYISFLQRHRVQNVILIGTVGNSLQRAAKVLRTRGIGPFNIEARRPTGGAVLITYPDRCTSTRTNIEEINTRINDYADWPLASQVQIADWESGLSHGQVIGLSADAKTVAPAVDLVSSNDDTLALYDFGTYVTLAFMRKNAAVFNANGGGPVGIALNPYLISHTIYESKIGYIPLLFWQGNPAETTIERMRRTVTDAMAHYFPSVRFESLRIWVNCTNNFAASEHAIALIEEIEKAPHGVIETNDYTIDEVWNPRDGMNAPVETVAANIVTFSSYLQLQAWDNQLLELTLNDLEDIPNRLTSITIIRQ